MQNININILKQEHKVQLLKTLLITSGTIIGILGLYRFASGNSMQGILDVLLVIVLFLSYFKISSDHSAYVGIVRLAMISSLIMAIYLVINLQESPMRFIWFTTIVYITFFLLENRDVKYIVSTSTAILVLLFVYDQTLIGLSAMDFAVWIFNMFIIILVVTWYEKIENEAQKEMSNIHELLEKEIAAKTDELQKLNESLQERVTEEVDKNRLQEQMMMHQSRLAQMGEMLSMIAHQWRQPLNAISATTNTMIIRNRRGKYEQDVFDERLHKISNYSQHLSTTIDDFRNFFKQDKVKEETSLSLIAQSVLELISDELVFHDIALHTDYQCKEHIPIYANEIRQVILNLVKNAEDALLEHKIERPMINIRTYSHKEHSVLEVIDNAKGIEASLIDKIFEPYFTTKEEHNGTGLGLYMSKTIVEKHCNGELQVLSNSYGTIFKIIIPKM